jgi:hypothetical protein
MDVMVGGYGRKSVTVHVPGDIVIDACEEGESVGFGEGQEPVGRHHQGPGQVDQLWIDDADGAIVVIDAMDRPDRPPGSSRRPALAESATFVLRRSRASRVPRA